MKLTKIMAGSAIVLAVAAYANAPAPADVVYGEYGEVEASLTGAAGNAEEGAAIYADKGRGNCVACHQIGSSEATFQGTVGPSLDGVGSRWNEAELRGIVADAKKTFEGTIMPSFYKNDGYVRPGDAFTGKAPAGELAPLLSAQEIEDVVAYLMTLTE